MQMWHLGTGLSGGLGSVELMVGLDDPTGLFQPKGFYFYKLRCIRSLLVWQKGRWDTPVSLAEETPISQSWSWGALPNWSYWS